MITIVNTSQTRTIVHEEAGKLFRVEAGGSLQVPEAIAPALLRGWSIAKVAGEEVTVVPEPWEFKCGDAWTAAKAAMPSIGQDIEKTTGAHYAEVIEPEIPADARGEDGKLIESKLNKHVCSNCAQEFPTLKGCRLHMSKMHAS